MKLFIITVLLLVLAGCSPNFQPDYERQEELFFKCLELTNQDRDRNTHYSDKSKTVRQCRQSAIQLTRKCVKNCTNTALAY